MCVCVCVRVCVCEDIYAIVSCEYMYSTLYPGCSYLSINQTIIVRLYVCLDVCMYVCMVSI